MKLRTLNEAADALGVTRMRLKRGTDDGRYPAMHWQNRLLVDLDVIEPIIRDEDRGHEDAVGISQLSEMTGLPVGTIRRMCRENYLPYEKLKNGRYQFSAEAVMRALQDMME